MSKEFPNIYLVRHGATEWSVTGQHTGRSDIALTAQGEKEALFLREMLIAEHPGIFKMNILVSPLKRAYRTAELIGFKDFTVDPDIQEWSYGELEGLRSSEIRERIPGWNVYENGCPKGESLIDVEARADAVIGRIRDSGMDTVLVAHGHFLCVFTGCWLGLGGMGGRKFQLDTASLSLLTYHHSLEEPVVRLWNDRRSAV